MRPHCVSADTGEFLLLEDAIANWMDANHHGIIQIVGRLGSGKSTAIRHLSVVNPPHTRLHYFDPGDRAEVESFAEVGFAITTIRAVAESEVAHCQLSLTAWSEDDWIEYLLASSPQK